MRVRVFFIVLVWCLGKTALGMSPAESPRSLRRCLREVLLSGQQASRHLQRVILSPSSFAENGDCHFDWAPIVASGKPFVLQFVTENGRKIEETLLEVTGMEVFAGREFAEADPGKRFVALGNEIASLSQSLQRNTLLYAVATASDPFGPFSLFSTRPSVTFEPGLNPSARVEIDRYRNDHGLPFSLHYILAGSPRVNRPPVLAPIVETESLFRRLSLQSKTDAGLVALYYIVPNGQGQNLVFHYRPHWAY